MAVPTNATFSNAIPGVMTAGADIDVYETNSTPKWDVGTGFTRQDGNKYRYASFVTATTQGLLVSQDFSDTGHVSTNALVVAPSATYQMPDDPNGVYPGAIGSKYVIWTHASITANQFAGGYFVANKDTGYGYIYRIRGNTASNDPASGVIRIELCERLQASLAADTDTAIIGSLYNDLRANTVATDFIAAGVTMANQSANTYGWICTHGICTCLQEDTVANGDIIQAAAATAGAFATAGVGTTTVAGFASANLLGYAVDQAGTGNYSTIYLQLE